MHQLAKDITGERYGRLIAVSSFSKKQAKGTRLFWNCKCDCGKETTVCGTSLRNGATKSCGCWNDESATMSNRKHGMSNTKEYESWANMIQRCTNKNNKSYKNYGGKGITVCERWMKAENFLSDMGPKPSPAHTIERVSNRGNYEPGNCVWETRKVQCNNKSNNTIVSFNGENLPIMMMGEKYGIYGPTFASRINKAGWSIQKAIETPVRGCGSRSRK